MSHYSSGQHTKPFIFDHLLQRCKTQVTYIKNAIIQKYEATVDAKRPILGLRHNTYDVLWSHMKERET